jgi:tRNA-dihydrouridine synthase
MEIATQAAHHADVDGINFNMVCPKNFSVGGGMGSALLLNVQNATCNFSTVTIAFTIIYAIVG